MEEPGKARRKVEADGLRVSLRVAEAGVKACVGVDKAEWRPARPRAAPEHSRALAEWRRELAERSLAVARKPEELSLEARAGQWVLVGPSVVRAMASLIPYRTQREGPRRSRRTEPAAVTTIRMRRAASAVDKNRPGISALIRIRGPVGRRQAARVEARLRTKDSGPARAGD